MNRRQEMSRRHRIGRWTVFLYNDGTFNHARHEDPKIPIQWTLRDLHAVAPHVADKFDETR